MIRGTTPRGSKLAMVMAAAIWWSGSALAAPPGNAPAGGLDSRRLLGKAYYENDDFDAAAREFRRCVKLAPRSALDHFNLALVLLRARKHDESLTLLDKAEQLDPTLVAPHYLRAIILKRQGKFEDAVKSLKHVIGRNPKCLGAYYNIGQCYKYLKRYEPAREAMESVVRLSPDHPSAHYQLITIARRLKDVELAALHKEIFDRVKDTVDASEKTPEALERSKYSYIIEAPRAQADLVPKPDAKVRFVDVTVPSGLPKPGTSGTASAQILSSARPMPGQADPETLRDFYAPLLGNAVSLADYDADGDLDIYLVNCSTDASQSANRLYQNQGNGKFVDVTAAAGVADAGLGFDAVFGDYDNDGHIDLYVVNCGPNVLYHNKGDGTFEDVSKAARVDEPQFGRTALFFDYDHDNDLDLFIGNCLDFAAPTRETQAVTALAALPGQPNTLLRNNGNGTFSDVTDEAGLLDAIEQTHAALFADFEGDHDTDLVIINDGAPLKLFLNARLGRFAEGGSLTPPRAFVSAAVEGDFNRDGHSDLVLAAGPMLYLYENDGRANFVGLPLTVSGEHPIGSLAVLDYNNDGWNDLLVARAHSLHVLAGIGKSKFREVTQRVGLDKSFEATSNAFIADVAAGDLDNDGDTDIVVHTRDRGPIILRNEGGNRQRWLQIHPVGKKVNRSAYAATIEVAAGGHYQKQTVRNNPVHFGLGNLESVDVVRVIWPNGVAQNVIRPELGKPLTVKELVKVSASCGFLYAFNGQGFELINEILGVGPLGVPISPGTYHQPDCTELTKIESHQLVARNGRYELRLTEELWETMYADQFTLRIVDHPSDREIIPNEMFTAPPFPEDKFYAVKNDGVPVAAEDDRGADLLDEVTRRDGRHVTFPLTDYDGLAEPHSLTLDLGDLSDASSILLCLDGWIYWPSSSTVMAIDQDPRCALTPLRLEVPDGQGRWQTTIESVGLPTSKGLVVPVDLTDQFPAGDYRVRLSTTLCVYFDRVFVATRDDAETCRVTERPVVEADLHYRGFSPMTRDVLGFERFDYAEVSDFGSWNQAEGLHTRYGDVTPLLAQPDDAYVIFGPGDELTLHFDATALPQLPAGWARDFIFYANGWVKDGDLNTLSSQTVAPLPFHGMSGYPYPESQSYPDTPEHLRYQRMYNTRPGRSTIGPLPGVTAEPFRTEVSIAD